MAREYKKDLDPKIMRLRDSILEKYGSFANFGKCTGAKLTTWNPYLSGSRIPSDYIMKKLCEEVGINFNYIKTGEGEVYINNNASAQENSTVLQESNINGDFQCGNTTQNISLPADYEKIITPSGQIEVIKSDPKKINPDLFDVMLSAKEEKIASLEHNIKVLQGSITNLERHILFLQRLLEKNP